MELHSIYKQIEKWSLTSTGTYRMLAQYVLKNINTFDNLSIKKIAADCKVSDATIVRFCKELGFNGFYEFRKLVEEVNKNHRFNNHEILVKKESTANVMDFYAHYLEILEQGRTKIRELIASDQLKYAAWMLYHAKNIYMVGSNINYHQSLDFRNKMIGYGRPVLLENDFHTMDSFANVSGPGDVFITLSLSGKNVNIINLGKLAKMNGAKWLHITANWNPQLCADPSPDLLLAYECNENQLWNLYTIRGALLFELETLLFIELTLCDPKNRSSQ